MALAAVTSGLRTSFAVIADDDSMEGLRAACLQIDGDESGGRPGLEVHVGVPPDRDVMPDLTVTAIVLDTDSPKLPADRPLGDTVLSVSASSPPTSNWPGWPSWPAVVVKSSRAYSWPTPPGRPDPRSLPGQQNYDHSCLTTPDDRRQASGLVRSRSMTGSSARGVAGRSPNTSDVDV